MPGPAGVPTGRVPGTSPRSAAVPVRRTLARQHATCNPACGVPSPRTIGAATGHLGVGGVDDCPHEAPPSGFSVKVKGLRGSPSSDHVDVPPGPVRLAPGEIGKPATETPGPPTRSRYSRRRLPCQAPGPISQPPLQPGRCVRQCPRPRCRNSGPTIGSSRRGIRHSWPTRPAWTRSGGISSLTPNPAVLTRTRPRATASTPRHRRSAHRPCRHTRDRRRPPSRRLPLPLPSPPIHRPARDGPSARLHHLHRSALRRTRSCPPPAPAAGRIGMRRGRRHFRLARRSPQPPTT